MELIWLLISYAVFSIIPAVLLGFEYNLAVGSGFGALSLTLLAIFHELVKLRDELKQNTPFRGKS